MSWTELTYARDYITGEIFSHAGLLRRISLYEGKRAGNKIYIPYFGTSTVTAVNVDSVLASDRDNTIITLTAADYATRTALKGSELQTYENDRSMQLGLFEQHANGLRIQMESGLDTTLATSTNTQALTTDNTYTMALFMAGLADILGAGATMEECTMITGAAGWASLMAAGFANAGGSVGSIPGAAGLLFGTIPVVVSAQCTVATTTGGAAGYLFARKGIVGAVADVETVGPVFNSGTTSYDIVSMMYYAYDIVGGTGSDLVVKFTNP